MLSVFRILSYCTFIVTNMSLPGGSNIFREVLQEFVKPCPYEQSDDSSDDGSKSDEELFVSRKDSPRQKQKRLRVQWADESSQSPLAAEPYETHSARIFTKTVPKPILKCKSNYLIVMPQWTVCEVRRHFQTWWTISSPSLFKSRREETLRNSPSHGRKRWLRLTGKGRGARRTHSVTLSIRCKSKRNIINDCNLSLILNIFCMYIHLCLCYVQLCITMFFVFHMVLRTAIYNYRLHCGRNKNHIYKICESVFYISFLSLNYSIWKYFITIWICRSYL